MFSLSFPGDSFYALKIQSCRLTSLVFYRPPSRTIVISELEFDKQVSRYLIMCFPNPAGKGSKIFESEENTFICPSIGFRKRLNFMNIYLQDPLAGLLKIFRKINYLEAKQKAGLCFAIQP